MNNKIRWVVILCMFAALAITAYYLLRPTKKPAMETGNSAFSADPSIAVIPLVNISKDSTQEYFSDGLTDEIRNSLARLSGLKVSARTSSSKFKGASADIREIGRKLGVHAVLMGTVQRETDQIKIFIKLMNADNGQLIWSEKYDDGLDDIFNLQSKITQSIAEKLSLTLLGANQQTVSRHFKTNREAYELYLKARSFWNKRTPPDLMKAITLFKQALSLDTSFAAAYSGISDCYNALGYASFIAPMDAFPKALEAAARAIQLDSTLAEPHASMGFYKFYYAWDWEEAEQEFRAAIAMDQNYELGYAWYGYYLTSMQRFSEAKIILGKAAELDPLSTPISTDMGFSSYYSGNYDSAIAELQRVLKANPGYPFAHIWLGRAYQAKKSFSQAIEEYKSSLKPANDWPVGLAQLGNAYGVSGDKLDAHKILDSLIGLSSRKFVTAYGMALQYAGLDQNDMAILWLNKAYNEHSNWMVWVKLDPRWAGVSKDKRYIELVNKMAFPQSY
jgi:TolB-like protein/Tfp pilus assembly protein PilF